ncbi:unnamed protein product [Closterium sp. NIES-53]
MEALEFNILRIEDAVVSVATTDEWWLEAVDLAHGAQKRKEPPMKGGGTATMAGELAAAVPGATREVPGLTSGEDGAHLAAPAEDGAHLLKAGALGKKNKGGELKRQKKLNLLLFPSAALHASLHLRHSPLTFSRIATLGTPSTGAMSPQPCVAQSTDLIPSRTNPLSSP